MNFLKSAVASAISQGPPFPYSFGDRVDVDASIWMLYNGTRREDNSNCSIFSFDVTANKSRLPLARNFVRKLKTLRHPGVIKVFDSVETETYIYIATERVVPLSWPVKRKSLSPETIKWGLYTTANTVRFINDDASSIHGNLKVSSIYISESGEWKLAGFEVLSSLKDDDAVLYSYGAAVPESGKYAPPEVAKAGWDSVKKNPISAVDSYNFGGLIYEIFNGPYTNSTQLTSPQSVPPTMQAGYKRLINANPKARLSVAHFLEQGKRSGGFFETPLIRLTEGLDNLGVKSEAERDELLTELEELSDDFPEELFKMKVLPELVKSVEYGGGGPKVFGAIIKIGEKLSDEDFTAKITPVLVRLYTVPDRALRVCLLDNLPRYIERLSQKVVNDQIFPQVASGFTDLAPIVREQTVKSVLSLVSKLSDRTINGELLRHLAKTASDDQPGIRTNTTICLGKIARNMGASKVLIAAFTRSLKDPFVHGRNAALLALGATSDIFNEEDCAIKILPGICASLVDKEKLIRDSATRTMDIYMARVKKYAATLPDTTIPAGSDAVAGPRIGTPANDKSWAGWAISSFTNKLSAATGAMEGGGASASASASASRATSAPPAANAARPPPSRAPATTLSARPALLSPAESTRTSISGFRDEEPAATDNDFFAWGDGDEGVEAEAEDEFGGATAEAEEDEDPFEAKQATASRLSSSKPSSATPFDDGGEPDFAGWLAAQSAAKSKTKAKLGLPKGLNKATNNKAGATAGQASTKPKTSKPLAAKKAISTKPVEDATGEDDWGAWD